MGCSLFALTLLIHTRTKIHFSGLITYLYFYVACEAIEDAV